MTDIDIYDAERRSEHSTLGDAGKRFRRDRDAFTAGAQYALDTLISRSDWVATELKQTHIHTWLVGSATDILSNVHTGQL